MCCEDELVAFSINTVKPNFKVYRLTILTQYIIYYQIFVVHTTYALTLTVYIDAVNPFKIHLYNLKMYIGR